MSCCIELHHFLPKIWQIRAAKTQFLTVRTVAAKYSLKAIVCLRTLKNVSPDRKIFLINKLEEYWFKKIYMYEKTESIG